MPAHLVLKQQLKLEDLLLVPHTLPNPYYRFLSGWASTAPSATGMEPGQTLQTHQGAHKTRRSRPPGAEAAAGS